MGTLLYGGRPRQVGWLGPFIPQGVYVENQDATCPDTFLRLLHLYLLPGKMDSGATVFSVFSAFFILTIKFLATVSQDSSNSGQEVGPCLIMDRAQQQLWSVRGLLGELYLPYRAVVLNLSNVATL